MGKDGLVLTDSGLPLEAFNLIRAEDAAQIERWGNQQHTIFEWLAILGEEVGELSKEVLESRFGDVRGATESIEKEAVQVATLALKVAWMIRQERKAQYSNLKISAPELEILEQEPEWRER